MTTATLASQTEFTFSGDLSDVANTVPVTIESTSVTNVERSSLLKTNVTKLPKAARPAPTTIGQKDQDDVSGIMALAMLLLIGASAVAFTGLLAANFYSSMLRFSQFDIVRMLGM